VKRISLHDDHLHVSIHHDQTNESMSRHLKVNNFVFRILTMTVTLQCILRCVLDLFCKHIQCAHGQYVRTRDIPAVGDVMSIYLSTQTTGKINTCL
jgi:hypothetical protein